MATIITINRQYGSGGTHVAMQLAKDLGFKYYDKELISLAAKESGYTETFFENADEKPSNSLLYSLVTSAYSTTGWFHPVDIQAGVIKSVAAEGNCILVGRCANFLLRNEPNMLSIFTKASMPYRMDFARTEHPELDDKELETYLKKTDKTRSNYYNYYTGHKWGRMENYDLAVSTDIIGIDGAAKLIADFAEISFSAL